MKLKTVLVFALAAMIIGGCSSQPEGINLEDISAQLDLLDKNVKELRESGSEDLMPRNIEPDGSLHMVKGPDWTVGFYPGMLWYMYELSGVDSWKERAMAETMLIEDMQYVASNHDVGFRMYCSFGNALRLTGNEDLVPVIVQSAETLTSRFYEQVGCTRSWDFNQKTWMCPVIIDNMMNLELFFRATELSGDPKYREMAISHADVTLANHFRPDHSSYHVVDYDTISGEARLKHTHQGSGHETAWARGQAWGLYGFTMCYRFTEDERYLQQAENIATFILDDVNMPEDLVPYWDYDAPGIPDAPRDASAAAIIASALYELSDYSENGALYLEKANAIVSALSTTYASEPGGNMGFVLGHSVGNMNNDSEVDVSINYGDYYYLEALVRQRDRVAEQN